MEWAGDAAEAHAQHERVARLRGWGYAAEWLTKASCGRWSRTSTPTRSVTRHRVLPGRRLDGPGAVYRSAREPGGRAGGRIRAGARVDELLSTGGVVRVVRLTSGETIAADLVVNCTGQATNSVTAERGLHVPMASTLGLLAYTAPTATTLRRVIQAAGGIAIRPDGAGRLVVHSNDADEMLKPETPARADIPLVVEMMAHAARIMPALAGHGAEAARIAVRSDPRRRASGGGSAAGDQRLLRRRHP